MSDQIAESDPYERIIEELSYDFDGVVSTDTVRAVVDEARARLEPTAKIRTFLPVLTARFARELLTASGQAEGRITKKVPEILFVCVHNAGRSQLAAALADSLSGGRVHVRSAGSQPMPDLNPLVVEVLAERGIALEAAYSKPLTDRVVRAADVIVTMGCGDACPVYPGKRYLDWDVADPADQSLDTVRDIRDDLIQRVNGLLRELAI